MSKKGLYDDYTETIRRVLEEKYLPDHPRAAIDVYRHSSACVRIRVIDPDFKGSNLVKREKTLWAILDTLPEKVRADISVLLLLTQEERPDSYLSEQFDNPRRARY